MIYLWNDNGNVVFYGTLEGAKIDGYENPDLTVEDSVFEEANGQVRIINDEFFFGPTDEEKAEEEKRLRKIEIMNELDKIDLQTIRSMRAVAAGVSSKDDEKKLAELEKKAEGLRKELTEL